MGGYNPVQYKRNLPVRGFRPAVYLLGTGVLMTYGFWRVGQGIREHKYVLDALIAGQLGWLRDSQQACALYVGMETLT